MTLKEAIKSNKFIVTAEIAPPKGVDIEELLERAEILRGIVDAINVTDNQRAVMRLSSISFCAKLAEKGFDPILQMTCRDKNALALQSDVLGAYVLGIRNILALSGDYPNKSDQPGVKPVFDLDSVQLIKMIRTMESGKDLGENEIEGEFSFCVGAIVTPEADPLEPQLLKFRKKIIAGAEFIQTQAIYDLDKFRKFMDTVQGIKNQAKILAGIVLLTSAGMAKYMNENVPGVTVPQNFIDELKAVQKEDRLKKGIEIAARLIKAIHKEKLCDGVHIMAIGKEHIVPEILKESGLSNEDIT